MRIYSYLSCGDRLLTPIEEAINDYGSVNSEGKKSIAYGVLFDKTADTCESELPV
jgi:hypothetical protein